MELHRKYNVLGQLGNHSKRKFGSSLLVEEIETGRKLVMKTIEKNDQNKIACDRLRNEATFDFKLNELPTIHSFKETNERISLLKNYIEGETIDQFWKTVKTREQNSFLIQFITKLIPLFDELEHVNVVHCDIKPGNLIISKTNRDFHVHLIDFGLAVNKMNPECRPTLFPLGYAAPELLLNKLELVNQGTDIFALGNLIWRLKTGKIPLTHPNPSIFTNLQLTHPLPEHESIRSDLYNVLAKMTKKHAFSTPPNKLNEQVVRKALKKAIEDRYTNLSEVKQAMTSLKRNHWLFPDNVFAVS